MQNSLYPTIPVELMELLNRINDNVNEVKERLARLEGQDNSQSIQNLRSEIEKERDKRITLEIDLANVKTKLAPLLVGISIIATVVIQLVGNAVHL